MKNDIVRALVILIVASIVYWVGWHTGFMHVVLESKAYAIEDGDVLMLEIDGQAFEYEVSPRFYQRLGQM